jgi:hypothetical protein
MTPQISSENMNLFILRYVIATFIATLLGYALTITQTIDASQIVYIGPFLVAIITAEHMFNRYSIPANVWLSQPKFWILALICQIITLLSILYAKSIPFDGQAYVFVAQTVFTIFGILVASLYQKVRGGKK